MSIFTEIKSALPADVVLTHFLGPPRFRRFCCPFHNDHHPSMTTKASRIVCWACGWRGDVFTFIEQHQGLSKAETLRVAADFAGIILPDRPKRKSKGLRLPSLRASLLQVRREIGEILYELERDAAEAWRSAWEQRDADRVWDAVAVGSFLDRHIARARSYHE